LRAPSFRSVWLLTVVWLGLSICRPLDIFDEGMLLTGAARLLAGHQLYRDTFAVYPPGQFFLLEALFAVTGVSPLAMRVLHVTVAATLVGVVVLLVRDARVGSAKTWLIAVLSAFALVLQPSPNVVSALLLSLLGLRAALARRALVSGLLGGMAFLFRLDFGLVGALASLIAVSSGRGLMSWLGAAIVPLAGMRLLLWNVPLGTIHEQLVSVGLVQLGPFRRLTSPFLMPWEAIRVVSTAPSALQRLPAITRDVAWTWFPLVVVLGACATLARTGLQRTTEVRRHLGLVTILLGAILYEQLRFDSVHVAPAVILSVMVAGLQSWPTWCWALAVCTLPALVAAPVQAWAREVRPVWPPAAQLEPDQRAALTWIEANVPDGTAIYVGNDQHHRVFVNDASFYALANRPSATRYTELEPGFTTQAAIQREMIAELERAQLPCVVLRSTTGDPVEANAAGREDGAKLLDDYIHERFAPKIEFGGYAIHCRSH
jgi:hypothetical protein